MSTISRQDHSTQCRPSPGFVSALFSLFSYKEFAVNWDAFGALAEWLGALVVESPRIVLENWVTRETIPLDALEFAG